MPDFGAYRAMGRLIGPVVAGRFPRRFGLFELLGIGSIESSRRQLAIVNELEQIRGQTDRPVLDVLDFGGADGSLGRTIRMYGLERSYRVTVADIDEEALKLSTGAPNFRSVVLDAEGKLPFEDDSFDVAVSSDVFEHIPRLSRRGRVAELERVSRLGQVHTVPADDGGRRWISVREDLEFADWQEQSFGVVDRWTREHLAIGAPTFEELRNLFPGGRIEGIVSGKVWARTTRAKYDSPSPLNRMRFAVEYTRHLRRFERTAPYKTAIIVVRVAPADNPATGSAGA